MLLASSDTINQPPRIWRGAMPFAAALGVGAIAMVSPLLALATLAVLATTTLLRAPLLRTDVTAFAGPVLAALVVGVFAGLDGAVGVLFVWRLFADARWSAGEATRLATLAGRPHETSALSLAHVWTTPLFGLALVAYTAPHMVAGLPLDLPHVPLWVPIAAGVIAGAAVFDWALRRAAEWRLNDLALAPTAHLLAHHALFLLAFGVGLDVSAGIVAMAAWRLAHAARQPSFTAVP
ncbi:MAG: hypothetical protein K2P58_01265 [Hyphomonadaceae bacterium]|nr:hypothetical protein [Hyphomonadaceae bacterium]